MKFIAVGTLILCPVCDSRLAATREQDSRVATMTHPSTSAAPAAAAARCPFQSRTFRVDRRTGDAEEVTIHETQPAKILVSSHGICA